MEYKEQVLANICSILNGLPVLPKNQGRFKEILRCCGLAELYEEYSELLEPYIYEFSRGRTWENPSPTFNLFIGLDNIFSDLYEKKDNEGIVRILVEVVKHFNPKYIKKLNPDIYSLNEDLYNSFKQLSNLYNVFGLQLIIDYDKERFEVAHFTQGIGERVKDVLLVEDWLKQKSPIAYDAYISAIQSYQSSRAGASIESCRTVLTSIFSLYRGTQSFAKWTGGVAICSDEISESPTKENLKELTSSIKKLKAELSDFFGENYDGDFKKTRAIYSIYSMMSDYGTHRGEGSIQVPKLRDALMILRMTEDILIWIYLKECE